MCCTIQCIQTKYVPSEAGKTINLKFNIVKSKNETLSPYERAQKRVDAIKGFYGHLVVYIVVCTVLLLARKKIHVVLLSSAVFGEADFLNYVDWNVYGTPILWG